MESAKIRKEREAKERVKAFEKEQRRQRIIQISIGSGIVITGTFLFMLFAPEYFSGILRVFGLEGFYHEETGLYAADCRKKNGRNSELCRQPKSNYTTDLNKKGAGSGPAFGL